MTTSKKQTASNSKVRNTKATFKTGQNVSAESLMKQAFEPLFSAKDGKVRLTFCGVEHSTITLKATGEQKTIIRLAFSVFDVTHEAPQTIGITCDYRLSEKNKLGQVLSIMGYQFEKESIVVDSDDEFGIKTKQNDVKQVFDFLRAQCGLVFKGSLKPVIKTNQKTGETYESGLWEIDYPTLEPKLNKAGVQERDMMSGDVSDEDFTAPDIAMASESD